MKNKIQLIEDKLKKSGIKYNLIPLPESLPLDIPSHVMFYKITFSQATATILYKTDKGIVAIQRRADTKFNLEKLKQAIGVKQLEFASESDLRELGTKNGLVPLFGLQVKYFIDKKVLEQGKIYGSSGDGLFGLAIQAKDLPKVNNGQIIDVTERPILGKKRVYSGVRATGRLHLGNYLGAVKGMLALQDDYDCTFSVVDLHAMTTPYDPKTLKDSIRSVILDFLSAGLDPEKCRLEIQSQVPQHTELSFLLATLYPLAPLEDLPTFKDKKAQYPKNVNTALLYYPILMAADVLLYKGELVPVGIDQEPHMEVMRECARKFNQVYGDTFPEPYRFKTMGEYVPSLTGAGKMSKTVEGSFINLNDDFETIKRKLAKVPTDAGTTGGDVPKIGGVATLFVLLALFNRDDMHKKYKQDYMDGKIRYGELKAFLSERIYDELKPIQEKRKYFEEHPKIVDEILKMGNEKCLKIAEETMKEVKEKMGLSI